MGIPYVSSLLIRWAPPPLLYLIAPLVVLLMTLEKGEANAVTSAADCVLRGRLRGF